MAHRRKIYRFPTSNEYEYTYKGRYGAKGEKRGPRRRKTPREIEYQNRMNKRTYIRRLIKLNFVDGIWVTLTYGRGVRKCMDDVKGDFEKFREKMRYAYRKAGCKFDYIYVIEIGRKGGIHIHMITNRKTGPPETDRLISEKWTHGHVHITPLYEDGDYEQLACYMAKVPPEESEKDKRSRIDRMEQIIEDQYDYGTSRGLKKPVPEVKDYRSRTVRSMIEDGPEPTPGYYIDKSSIRTGINRFTGMSYLYYTEHLIKRERGAG